MDAEARRHRMDEFFEALRVLRMPAVVALLAVCLLVLPDQVRDLYRALAENLRKPEAATIALSQAAFTALTLLLAAFLTFYVGRHRAAMHLAKSSNPGQVLSSTLRWGPPLCGTLLLAGAALGMFLAVRDVSGIATHVGPDFERIIAEMRAAARHLTLAATGVAVVAVLFLVATYSWQRWGSPPASPPSTAFGRPWRVLCYALTAFLVAMAFFPAISVPLSQHAGSLAIFLVFLCLLLVGLSLLQGASARHGIPFVLLLIVWSSRLDRARCRQHASHHRGRSAEGHPACLRDRQSLRGVARRAQGQGRIRGPALSRLSRRGRGRRPLCGAVHGQDSRPHPGSVPELLPARLRRQRRVRRQPRRRHVRSPRQERGDECAVEALQARPRRRAHARAPGEADRPAARRRFPCPDRGARAVCRSRPAHRAREPRLQHPRLDGPHADEPRSRAGGEHRGQLGEMGARTRRTRSPARSSSIGAPPTPARHC